MDGYTYSMKAIPTTFAGVRMRSRLEARWAAFFSACGWRWTYEPFDAEGWTPDFTLHMPTGEIYVEVKPTLTRRVISIFNEVAAPLVESVGAKALIVGSSPLMDRHRDGAVIGHGIDCSGDRPLWSTWEADDIVIGTCGGGGCRSGVVGMSTQNMGWTCWVCGSYDGNPASDAQGAGVDVKWANACNHTQWRGNP